MAGSYSHATTKRGKLRSNESFVGMVENLGDAYEMAEEMYGMIWYLANAVTVTAGTPGDEAALVDLARENYQLGLRVSPGVQR